MRRAEEPRRRLPPDKRLMEAGVEDNDLLVAVNTGREFETAMDTTTGGEIEEAEPSSDEAESETDEGATEEEGGGRARGGRHTLTKVDSAERNASRCLKSRQQPRTEVMS